jgi:hypothetical protein
MIELLLKFGVFVAGVILAISFIVMQVKRE